MRKNLIIFLIILSSLYVFLSWAGSGDEYQGERKLWKLDARLKEIGRDHLAITDFAVNRLKQDYLELIQRYPYINIDHKASISLSRVYMLEKKYGQARELLERLIHNEKSLLEIKIKALQEVVYSYSLENDHKGVIETYRRLRDDHPDSPEGLSAPLMIAKLHSDNNQFSQASGSLEEAIVYYQKRLEEGLSEEKTFYILHKLTICYMAQKRWDEAFDVLFQIFEEHPDSVLKNMKTADDVLQTVKTIALFTPENYERSVDLYQEYIERGEHHPLCNALKAALISLEDFKDQKEDLEKDGY